ncbi:EAL domain-containing protein [Salinibacillus xinjiangensis]|uniref:EAL domain-containing protein n=1 Tax=Salinibacillus xinjiangensis TaxID=1229268 RepID=A0A6G1X7Y0_9BACI|nr:EAL domain-containing protein [Salinibacillus xinjiangensis]MRG87111.1 EAL domain-containing protein [Salinibacillus xinjiangensis]
MSLIKELFQKKTPRSSHSHLKEMFTSLYLHDHQQPILMFDTDGTIIDINHRVMGKYGHRTIVYDYIQEDERDKCEHVLTNFSFKGHIHYTTFHFVLENKVVHKRVAIFPVKMDNEIIGGYMVAKKVKSTSQDPSLNIEEEQLREVIDHQSSTIKSYKTWLGAMEKYSNDIMCIADQDGNIQFLSPTYQKKLGYPVQERMDENIFAKVHPEDMEKTKAKYAELINQPNAKMKNEVRLLHKDGSYRTFDVIAINLIDDPSIRGILINFFDITEIKQTEKKARHYAYYNQITSLPNRSYFENFLDLFLEDAKEKGETFSLLHVDLDRFKFINDTLGQAIGDEFLKVVTERLKSFASQTSFLAHIRSDEFIFLIQNGESEMVTAMANQILKTFQEPFYYQDYEYFASASIGISIFPEAGGDRNSLIKNANIALSQAKKKGINQVVIYRPHADVETYKKFTLMTDLRKAVQEDELLLHFQPIIQAKSQKIVATEALVRWNHPEWGYIPPNEFISLAEENGFINAIGDWVLYKACQQLKNWQSQGIDPIVMSVNVSAIQFDQDSFVSHVKSVIEETGIDPKYLRLEITENVLVEDYVQVKEKLEQLKKLGVSIALDDFGKGYSSLIYLQHFNIDVLKVDKLFLKEVEENEKSKDLLRTIVELANKLSLEVVIEGVESAPQFEFVKGIGANHIQGFLFSKPLPEEELIPKLYEKYLSLEINKPSPIFEKRHFYRISFQFPLIGSFTIDSIMGHKVDVGNTNILIEDISAGGLRFLSNIQLPVRTNFIIQVSTIIGSEQIEHHGNVVWHRDIEDGIHQYGVEFHIEEHEQEELLKLLNILQGKLRKNDHSMLSYYVTTSPKCYFKHNS